MRRVARVGIGAACAALLVGTTGVAAANAADEGAATAVAATVQGADVLVSWAHSPQTVFEQWVTSTDLATGQQGGSAYVDPSATSALLPLGAGNFVGGHTYEVSVVSTYDDATSSSQAARSDAVDVTVPETVPSQPEDSPRCSLRQKQRTLTVTVPAAVTEDDDGTHTITDRTVTISKNGRPWQTRTVAGAAAGSVTLTVPYDPRSGGGSTWYTAAYSVSSAAGTSRPTDACSAALDTPRPKDFAIHSTLRGSAVTVTWAKPKSPTSPLKRYDVSWQLGAKKMHLKAVKPSASRTFTLHFGTAKRVRVDVVAVNGFGATTWEGVLWLKSAGTWRQGGGR